MKNSLIILLLFSAGVAAGIIIPELKWFSDNDISFKVLLVLMFFAGFCVSGDFSAFQIIKEKGGFLLLVPLLIAVGSLGGAAMVSLLMHDMPLKEGLAIGAGFGYYSLSSLYISAVSGEFYGTIALLTNIFREMATLLLSPLMVMGFGSLAPIASAGATSMDTTLPIISRYSGKEFTVVALINGVILTVAVPLLVSFILSF